VNKFLGKILDAKDGKTCRILAAGFSGSKQLSYSPLWTSPSERVRLPRSSSCLRLKFFVNASQEPKGLFPPVLAAILSQPLPISPFVPAPSSGAKLPRRFGSVGLTCGILRYRSRTRSRKLLDPTSPRATAPDFAQHEAAEARWLDLPFFPLEIDSGVHCIWLIEAYDEAGKRVLEESRQDRCADYFLIWQFNGGRRVVSSEAKACTIFAVGKPDQT
jgi:hypothetical protein